ncbi:MAG: mannose-1-phosphate guanylyltransferase, partial [Anaerolineae bacterium]|nr:mannose-1-phosphate guanylyltransferase [Anaerolineae bacterium]
MEHFYAMIMAGGGGTRLWPMSRQDTPKQLLPLVEDDSMFKVSVNRLMPLFPPERIYVVTSRKYLDMLMKDAPDIPEGNFIIEPYAKDNGPAAGLGISVIQKRDPEATVAYLTSDHFIRDVEQFCNALTAAYDLAQKGHIVTLGIAPAFPATGFGYIRQGEEIGKFRDFTAYKSEGFTEKPNAVTATAFLASGDYSWNSGMFIWRADHAMCEFERQQPEMYQHLREIYEAVDTPEYEARLETAWDAMTKISIDFAVMEGAENIAVIPVDIGWNDIGSWSALYDVLKLDKFGNHFKNRTIEKVSLDTKNTLVY